MSSSAATVAQQSVSSSTFDDLSFGPTSQVVAGRILCVKPRLMKVKIEMLRLTPVNQPEFQ
ncbi:hypothetical protein F2Q70_00036274 [Brassica cretica]|uniref:Uncharacterized protein n=1 Tax=Brassica cretica TaxID=69181 RepID=A0A8S9JUV4_BRACR|nr:hypothetical protein F2Q70_00036274 [Brassica cretica]